MTDVAVRRVLGGLSASTEAGRALLIPAVAKEGFIRVRLARQHLGWQFYANAPGALEVLRRFGRRHDLGPALEIAFTDFQAGRTVETTLAQLLEDRPRREQPVHGTNDDLDVTNAEFHWIMDDVSLPPRWLVRREWRRAADSRGSTDGGE
ncbi:MAG: hypothetical protein H0W08_21010 [Acidobacteria bacterium]|nr:hypothetical protein [Acidobacteriota bacterium]